MGPDTIYQCQLQVLSGFSSQGDIQGTVRSASKLSGLVVFVGLSSDKLQRKTSVKLKICIRLNTQGGTQARRGHHAKPAILPVVDGVVPIVAPDVHVLGRRADQNSPLLFCSLRQRLLHETD